MKPFSELKTSYLLIVGPLGVATIGILLANQLYHEAGPLQPEKVWWQTGIIYQIYPRSFQDSNGDGIGDLQGIRSRLDYLEYLNIGAIWMNTIYKSPMRDFGYDVSDYRQVDPIFGTMDDFDELVKDCHARDIKVIVDLVPNHTSNESEWFNKSRQAGNSSSVFRDFYVWNPGKMVDGQRQPPNNWQSKFGGPAWELDPVRAEYYYHNYLSSQPDLNYRHQPVINEMGNVLRFWLEKGVDGLRIDAITYLFEEQDLSLNIEPVDPRQNQYQKDQPEIFGVIQQWRKIVDEFEKRDGKPSKASLKIQGGLCPFLSLVSWHTVLQNCIRGDRGRACTVHLERGVARATCQRVLSLLPEDLLWLAEAVAIDADIRINYYKAGAVPFYFKLVGAKQICNATAQCYLTLIKEGVAVDEGQWPTFVIGNHDHTRVSDEIGEAYIDVLNMMLLTLPGTPTTYYGEELGLPNANYTGLRPRDNKPRTLKDITRSRDPVRNPMQWDSSLNAGFTSSTNPWLPVPSNTNHTHVNVKVQMSDPRSHLSLYKRLAHLRQRPAFQTTAIELPESVKDILVYTRGTNSEVYAVLLNFGLRQSTANLEFLKTRYAKGVVDISTASREGHEVALSNVILQKGEGMVLKLSP